MQKKIKVAVLGCTGAVGQKIVSLLCDHPFFVLTELIASENSAGKLYGDCALWREAEKLPVNIRDLTIKKSNVDLDAQILFSGLDSAVAGEIETFYAEKGYVVVSNSKNHRLDNDVPLVIPEINAAHLAITKQQQDKHLKDRGSSGYIVTNPNCSIAVAALALAPIYRQFGLTKVLITTMQAISGAGYPGVPSLDILDNVIPYIQDEEAKMQAEILKILGNYQGAAIIPARFKVSAMCNRVPVRHGHTMSISFATEKKPEASEIIAAMNNFIGLNLPFAPKTVLQYFSNPLRPQPLLDRDAGGGMTVSVGNLRPCQVLDWKFTALGHNLIRGAAGAAILNAEYLVMNGYI